LQTELTFPLRLAEKYRGRTLSDFIGLERPKAVLATFLAKPYLEAFFFLGQKLDYRYEYVIMPMQA
jgi:hypothetical protein